jgi:hypothetical protein
VILVHDVPELNFRPRDCVVGACSAFVRQSPCAVLLAQRLMSGTPTIGRRSARSPQRFLGALFDAVPVFCDQHRAPPWRVMRSWRR